MINLFLINKLLLSRSNVVAILRAIECNTETENTVRS